jgi:hypothetical protein
MEMAAQTWTGKWWQYSGGNEHRHQDVGAPCRGRQDSWRQFLETSNSTLALDSTESGDILISQE